MSSIPDYTPKLTFWGRANAESKCPRLEYPQDHHVLQAVQHWESKDISLKTQGTNFIIFAIVHQYARRRFFGYLTSKLGGWPIV